MVSIVNLDADSQLEGIEKKASLSVLNFWADWAKPCVQIRSVLDELAKDSTISADTSFVHIEAEKFPEISQKYGVIAVPTCVLLKDGKVVDRINGVYPAEITQKVRSHSSVALPAVDLQTRLRQLVHSAPVMLFMKGSPDAVRCGFSRKMVELLARLNITYKSFDILSDEAVRQGLKEFSNWPSYPQLYANGELLGGLDIVTEMADNGELLPALPSDCVRRPLEQRLQELVRRERVMLFMKGAPAEPRCGFSRKIVAILQESGVSFGHFDILSDEEVRQGLKEFSKWPTYPQLYVDGELIGGLDIVKELSESGELKSTLTAS